MEQELIKIFEEMINYSGGTLTMEHLKEYIIRVLLYILKNK